MKKTKHMCSIGDSLYEGVILEKGLSKSKVILKCSKLDKGWTEKAFAKPPVVLLDDGNGIHVKFDDGKTIYLDYSQAAEIRVALNLNDSASRLPTKFKKWTLT